MKITARIPGALTFSALVSFPAIVGGQTWELIQTLSVPATCYCTTSSVALQTGRPYLIEASGTYYYGSPPLLTSRASAEFITTTTSGNGWVEYYPGHGDADDMLDLLVNGSQIQWLGSSDGGDSWAPHTYSSDNIYRFYATGAGQAKTFAVTDPIPGDNSGSLTVRIYAGNTAPVITTSPTNRAILAGGNTTFAVQATAWPPPQYQWYFDGNSILNATNATLNRASVTAADSGDYSVFVKNPVGLAVATIYLSVMTVGGDAAVPLVAPPLPARQSGRSNLVFITHGWIPRLPFPFDALPSPPPWISDMTNRLVEFLQGGGSNDWQVVDFYWLTNAWEKKADAALNNAITIGTQVGRQIAAQSWQHVHLIGHSAGAGLIQAAADEIRNGSTAIIHSTFLDPFLGFDLRGQPVYGTNAHWADNYFAFDYTLKYTAGELSNAHNVNVTWLDPRFIVAAGDSQVPISTHGWPHDFYTETVLGSGLDCALTYGFTRSKEGGGWDDRASYPIGKAATNLCGQVLPGPNRFPLDIGPHLDINLMPHSLSSSGVALFSDGRFILINSAGQTPRSDGQDGWPHAAGNDSDSSSNAVPWLAVGVTVTNPVNFVQFEAAFISTNSAAGEMTVFWNTNQIGAVDQRVAGLNERTYRFPLPVTVTNGLYTLSFRLDVFNTIPASIAVTNLIMGFYGVGQPVILEMQRDSNLLPVLRMTAASNFVYVIERSTNLLDWSPAAVLLNTNGTTSFADPAWTNSNRSFFRAVFP